MGRPLAKWPVRIGQKVHPNERGFLVTCENVSVRGSLVNRERNAQRHQTACRRQKQQLKELV